MVVDRWERRVYSKPLFNWKVASTEVQGSVKAFDQNEMTGRGLPLLCHPTQFDFDGTLHRRYEAVNGLRIRGIFLAGCVLAATFGARAFPVQVTARPEVGLTEEKLAAIASVAEEAIRTGKCPGAVVVVGHNGRVIYRKAFGHRALVPKKLPMTVDTIFDVASLTKVVATTTAIMQLVEQGKIV